MAAEGAAAALVARGLAPREARWLVEEFPLEADLERAAARRLAGEPLQYVIGHWPFRSLDLLVDHRALIPRPESEEVVGWALEALALAGARHARLLDLGCGSGALGLALLAELSERGVPAQLVAVDESEAALELTGENARALGLTAVTRRLGDWYSALEEDWGRSFDLIVANPPYVAAEEWPDLDPVLAFEPRGALLAGDAEGVAGLADVVAVVTGAPRWLTPGGALVVEHGAAHGPAARAVATSAGLVGAVTRQDLAGRDRALVAWSER